MNAGKIEISVLANYSALERQLREVTDKSVAAGRAAGKGLADEFTRASASFQSGLGAKLGGLIAFEKIARAADAALAKALEGGEWYEVALAGLRSLPIISTVADALEKAIDLVIGKTAQEKVFASQLDAAEKLRKNTEERLKTEKTIRDGIEKQRTREEEIVRKIGIVEAETVEDARLAARLKADDEIARLELQRTQELNAARSADQEKAIESRYRKERELVQANLDKEYRSIDSKEREAALRKAELDETVRKKALEDAQKQIQTLEERRQTVASETGTAQTRLGTFRFAAYSDAEKKAIDSAILAEIRQIRAKTGTIAQGGFA